MSPTTEILSILGLVVSAVAAVIVAVVRSSGGLRTDLAALGSRLVRIEERIANLPRTPVDEADCRERHDQQERRLSRVETAARMVLLAGLVLASAPVWAQDAAPPLEIPAIVAEQREAWHTGTLAGLVALVMLLTRLLRLPLAGRLLDRLPSEWRWTVPAALGVAGGVLTGLVAGQTWWVSALDGLGVGLAAIGAHSAVVRDLLGQPSPRAAVGAGQPPGA